MSKYLYQGFDISDIISTENAYNGGSQTIVNISNVFKQFPNIANTTINNANFDKCLTKNTSYSINLKDISGQLPSKAEFYQSTINNEYSFTIDATTFTNNISNATFNSSKTYPLSISNIYNSIGIILCGGGGGGGGSQRESVGGGYATAGGGGGGFCYVKNIDLNTYGRNYTLTVGGGGYCGANGNNRDLGALSPIWAAGNGGATSLISNNNAGHNVIAYGGAGGTPNDVTSNEGSSTSNFPNSVLYNTALTNNVSNRLGRQANGAFGGDNMYNSTALAYLSNYVTSTDISMVSNSVFLGTNVPGIPSGGIADSNNYVNGNFNNVIGSQNDAPKGAVDITFIRKPNNANSTYINAADVSNFYGSGGGGASGNNTPDSGRRGNPGAPGAPGFAVIYYYL